MSQIPTRAPAAALAALVLLAAGCAREGDAAPERSAANVPSAATVASAAASGPTITVYKSPTCGCCTKWEDHLREHGFEVVSVARNDVSPVKREHGVPQAMQSCHTGVVDGYAIEGHVPADVIRKLLAERPQVKGIAVPGMPMGSPGMEGPHKDDYEVFTFDETGPREVYAIR
ncbi:MAG TPA: DUF411 domain-containing protein [Longimicrobiaceae bacterium]|nr:DUF411 domain-containing protein [Longimicrobiaceae bacterium]